MQGLDVDFGSLDISEWDQRLPPPAAKTVVQSLPQLVISPQHAGNTEHMKPLVPPALRGPAEGIERSRLMAVSRFQCVCWFETEREGRVSDVCVSLIVRV